MLRAYLGGLTRGRLARLPFLGYWVLLWVLFALYGLGLAFAVGAVEPLIFEGPWAARDRLLEHFGPAVLAAFALFCLLFVFAQFNLIAKRIRDMGLPGWTVLVLIALGSAALAYVLPPGGELMRLENRVNSGFNGLLTLALLLIPGGLFARRARAVPAEAIEPAGTEPATSEPVGPGPADSATPVPTASVAETLGTDGEPARAPASGEPEPAALTEPEPPAAVSPDGPPSAAPVGPETAETAGGTSLPQAATEGPPVAGDAAPPPLVDHGEGHRE